MPAQRVFKPELLAPAGSLESFHAAVEAGADAVYLGVGEWNARLRARNFTVKTLSYLVGEARNKQVKLYVAVNTLVKQEELKAVLDLLYQLDQLKVDAVIVQDLGLAHLARICFPKLTLHASTQMVIHNSLGLEAIHRLGIKRAVLSRELTLEEIASMQQHSPVELEVFIHGALCYSISGLCLASSYLGGRSGNRGRCTQVCRRKFSQALESGFYFSPKDLCTAELIRRFCELGISSLKIEGRMKRPEYVYTVVSAYRSLLDQTGELDSAKADLTMDLGREKTSFLLQSGIPENIIVSDRPSGSGILLGNILEVSACRISLRTPLEIRVGDTLRVQNQQGAEGNTLLVEKVERHAELLELFFQNQITPQPGDGVFLISRKQQRHASWSKTRLDAEGIPYQTHFRASAKVLQGLKGKPVRPGTSEVLYLRINDPEWLNILKVFPFDYLVYSTDLPGLNGLLAEPKQLNYWRERLVIQLPPFLPEAELPGYRTLIAELGKRGVSHWQSSHFSQGLLFPKGSELLADTLVWTTNQASQTQLFALGYAHFTFSWEDDWLNIKAIAEERGIMPLFGLIPLFVSRIAPALEDQTRVMDANSAAFKVCAHNGLYYLLSETPLCLFQRRDKLKELGIYRYLIDFSFLPPSRKLFKSIMYNYQQQQKLPESTQFNHKSGFK